MKGYIVIITIEKLNCNVALIDTKREKGMKRDMKRVKKVILKFYYILQENKAISLIMEGVFFLGRMR